MTKYDYLFEYGWCNGKKCLEENKLSESEEEFLTHLTDIAFREMGERTRAGSGDDNYYVEGLYNCLNSHNNPKVLARIVYLLIRQLGFCPDLQMLEKTARAKEKKINEELARLTKECKISFEGGS